MLRQLYKKRLRNKSYYDHNAQHVEFMSTVTTL